MASIVRAKNISRFFRVFQSKITKSKSINYLSSSKTLFIQQPKH